jgi:hypothetical protein
MILYFLLHLRIEDFIILIELLLLFFFFFLFVLSNNLFIQNQQIWQILDEEVLLFLFFDFNVELLQIGNGLECSDDTFKLA